MEEAGQVESGAGECVRVVGGGAGARGVSCERRLLARHSEYFRRALSPRYCTCDGHCTCSLLLPEVEDKALVALVQWWQRAEKNGEGGGGEGQGGNGEGGGVGEGVGARESDGECEWGVWGRGRLLGAVCACAAYLLCERSLRHLAAVATARALVRPAWAPRALRALSHPHPALLPAYRALAARLVCDQPRCRMPPALARWYLAHPSRPALPLRPLWRWARRCGLKPLPALLAAAPAPLSPASQLRDLWQAVVAEQGAQRRCARVVRLLWALRRRGHALTPHAIRRARALSRRAALTCSWRVALSVAEAWVAGRGRARELPWVWRVWDGRALEVWSGAGRRGVREEAVCAAEAGVWGSWACAWRGRVVVSGGGLGARGERGWARHLRLWEPALAAWRAPGDGGGAGGRAPALRHHAALAVGDWLLLVGGLTNYRISSQCVWAVRVCGAGGSAGGEARRVCSLGEGVERAALAWRAATRALYVCARAYVYRIQVPSSRQLRAGCEARVTARYALGAAGAAPGGVQCACVWRGRVYVGAARAVWRLREEHAPHFLPAFTPARAPRYMQPTPCGRWLSVLSEAGAATAVGEGGRERAVELLREGAARTLWAGPGQWGGAGALLYSPPAHLPPPALRRSHPPPR